MKKLIISVCLAMALPLSLQAQDLEFSSCGRKIEYTMNFTPQAGDTYSWRYDTSTMLEGEMTISGGKLTKVFAAKTSSDGTEVANSFWAELIVSHSNGRTKQYTSNEEPDHLNCCPSVGYVLAQGGPNLFVIAVDEDGVSMVKQDSLALDFVLPDNWHIANIWEADGKRFCTFEKENGSPINMPPSLVYVYDPADECRLGSWGGQHPDFDNLNRSNEPSAFSNGQSIAGDAQVNVYDLSGIEVYTNHVNPAKFTLESTPLTNGIYVVKTTQPDGTVSTEKVTLNR